MPNPATLPRLIDLLPVDRIPSQLDFIEGALEQLLSEIHYKNFTFSIAKRGEAGSYTLTLVLDTEIGISIGGTDGMRLLLCPGVSTATTEIDVFFNYRLDALKHRGLLNIQSFDAQPLSYVNALMLVFGLKPADLFKSMLEEFEIGGLPDFITSFNAQSPTTALVQNSGYSPDDLVDVLYQVLDPSGNNLNFVQYFYDKYLSGIDLDDTFARIKKVFRKWIGDVSLEKFLDLFIPKFVIAIENIDLAIEFPRSIFIPLQDGSITTNPVTVAGDPLPEPYRSRLTFNVGSLIYSSETGFTFSGENTFDFAKAQIGNSGFTIDLDDLKLDLSRRKNIPEATADGRPYDFIGVYIKAGAIGFPSSWGHNNPNALTDPSSAELFVNNLLAGTGGISGTIGLRGVPLNTPTPLLKGKFGQKIKWELHAFEVIFRQNTIVSSDIQGKLIVPGFTNMNNGDVTLDILIHFAGNGDFSVTASALPSPPTWQIAGVLTVAVSSAYVGRKDGRFYLGVTGKINFIADIPVLGDVLPKGVEVKKLIVWDDGTIEFEGGNLVLTKAIALNVGPVKLSVTALSMGAYERGTRKYKYIGFDGGININPGGVDARANGVKLYYSVDEDPLDIFVRIEGIAIDLIIPGSASPEDAAVILSGFLTMKDPVDNASGANTEYTGAVSFSLPRAHIAGSAGIRFQPSWPAFLVDASLELATPIPLGSTGLSIYGFRGLIGLRYVASRDALAPAVTNESPWYQYYKHKVPPANREGIQAEKFAARKGFSLGAGVSIATGADQGKAFSSKLFLLLSLPEVLLLQGQAAIMRERIGLDTTQDPPFSALIAFSKHSVEAAFGVNYKLPEESGKIATVDGLIEMGFFFGNSSAWYINVGRDLPTEKRIQARILNLFNAYFYLMMSSGGIRAGAGASWAFSKSFGPVGIEAGAYIDLAGKISFKPKQIGGSIQLVSC
ncbi:MAG: hypothetical protein ABIQ40_04140 [Bacteroidia bacterium]